MHERDKLRMKTRVSSRQHHPVLSWTKHAGTALRRQEELGIEVHLRYSLETLPGDAIKSKGRIKAAKVPSHLSVEAETAGPVSQVHVHAHRCECIQCANILHSWQ